MAVIIANSTTSDVIERNPTQGGLVIRFPATMVGTSVKIQSTLDGTNWSDVYFDGALVSVSFVASTIHVIPPQRIHGLFKFRLVSNATETSEIRIRTSFADVV